MVSLWEPPHPSEGDAKLIDEWLVATYNHKGFHAYVRHRDLYFLKELGGGVALSPRGHDDYVGLIHQRIELLKLAEKGKKAHELHIARLREKQSQGR
jgi:hypothetical protein